MTDVRVRFAPSPTGYLHIGGARTALMNWAFARQYGGTFVLRIEDTDAERSTEASFEAMTASLKWLGLEWDEGTERGGPYGPYRQSECFQMYESEAERLLTAGDAYHCYCLPEELERRRTQALSEGRTSGYDNRCRLLSSSRKETFAHEGRRPVVRFRVPDAQAVVVDDMVRGRVRFDPGTISDFIILRADGRPTFHFANVLDDVRMRITHVIRGDDHLPNTPRHVLLYRALGAEPPRFAHHSLIHGPDGARLSKRHGATAIEEFKEAGYLPEAIVNWFGLLGFAPPDGREVFGLREFAQHLDLPALGKSAAVFDRAKLDWLNGIYIRNMPSERLWKLCEPYMARTGYEISEYPERELAEIVDSIRGNMTTLPDCVELAAPYFRPIEELLEPDAREYLKSTPAARQVVAAFAEELKSMNSLAPDGVKKIGRTLQKRVEVKGKDLYMPIRIAVTGRAHGPELTHALPLLGKARCLRRIEKVQAMVW